MVIAPTFFNVAIASRTNSPWSERTQRSRRLRHRCDCRNHGTLHRRWKTSNATSSVSLRLATQLTVLFSFLALVATFFERVFSAGPAASFCSAMRLMINFFWWSGLALQSSRKSRVPPGFRRDWRQYGVLLSSELNLNSLFPLFWNFLDYQCHLRHRAF